MSESYEILDAASALEKYSSRALSKMTRTTAASVNMTKKGYGT